ncbi:MAG: hypothetical protein IJF54_06000 [Clostridia bacterium]|nr:hypothetical protein [Clostridia bacterium]
MKKFLKWMENYWYHYKFRTVFIGFLIFVVVFFAVQELKREHYDYTVVLYLSETVSPEFEEAVERTLEKYADDFDGNGEVNVQLLNFSYSPYGSNNDYRLGQASALMGELQNNTTFLFITDSYRFDELNEKNIFEQQDFLDSKDNRCFALNYTPFHKNVYKEFSTISAAELTVSDMYISTRLAPEQGKKNYPHYEGALKMLQKIASDKGE